MKKLNVKLIVLILFVIGLLSSCAKPLCSAYTHQGVYYYEVGVIKRK